jgi:hypothetical protein
MDIRRGIQSNTTPSISSETSNRETDSVSQPSLEINQGIVSINDGLDATSAAKAGAYESILGSALEPTRDLQIDPAIKSAAFSMLDAIRQENPSMTDEEMAVQLRLAAAACETIPVVGPIIAAVLMAVAAIIAMIAEIAAKSLEQEAAKKEQQAGVSELSSNSVHKFKPDP